jgi:RNA polymerase sigma factor (sigma-70 family)
VTTPKDKYFPGTSWTLLAAAQDAGTEGRDAREEFARRYLRPVRNYISAVTGDYVEAEELTQGFFADVVAPGRLLARLDRERGSFRPYLKQAVRNYVITEMRSRGRKKRRADEELRPDDWSGDGWERLNLQAQASADVAFHEAWVRSLLQEALEKVKALCEQKGQSDHLDLFAGRYLCEAPEPPSWRDLGAAFGLDEKTARSRADTVARQFRAVLREMLREDLPSEKDIDREIATLLAFV